MRGFITFCWKSSIRKFPYLTLSYHISPSFPTCLLVRIRMYVRVKGSLSLAKSPIITELDGETYWALVATYNPLRTIRIDIHNTYPAIPVDILYRVYNLTYGIQ